MTFWLSKGPLHAHAAATAAASATLLPLLVPLLLLHAVLPCRTHVKARWKGRHGTAADWAEGGRGKHGSVLYAVTSSLPRVRVCVALLCSLLLSVFISRAAQRLHVDVVCLSEWDVILPCPALPCRLLRASYPCNLQLRFLSLVSTLSLSLIIWSSNRTPDGLRGPARSPF